MATFTNLGEACTVLMVITAAWDGILGDTTDGVITEWQETHGATMDSIQAAPVLAAITTQHILALDQTFQALTIPTI
jgi:hypothetical protein